MNSNNKIPQNQKHAILIKKDSVSDAKADTSGFFENCEQLMDGSSVGNLQGTDHSNDSTGNLCFFDNYENQSFEIILLLKGGPAKRADVGPEKISKMFHNGYQNTFNQFDCFAFVFPQRDPDKQQDVHDMNIDFPVVVKAYKRIDNDNWKYIRTVKEKAFEDFSEFQFETIYAE
ncbi:MAG: hypothetical protein ACTHK8_09195 [Ginsengibacter sp.]